MTLRQYIDDFKQRLKNKSFLNSVGAFLKDLGASLNVFKTINNYIRQRQEEKKKYMQVQFELKELEAERNRKPENDKIFIVQSGKVDQYKLKVTKEFLEKRLHLEPIYAKPSRYSTCFESSETFNNIRKDCSAAIIFLSNNAETQEIKTELYFEVGYFLGKFHKEKQSKIILMYQKNTTIPNEFQRIPAILYDKSIKKTFYQLQSQLKYWKFPI